MCRYSCLPLPCHLIAGSTVIDPQFLGLHLGEEESAVPADPPLLRDGRLQALNTLGRQSTLHLKQRLRNGFGETGLENIKAVMTLVTSQSSIEQSI